MIPKIIHYCWFGGESATGAGSEVYRELEEVLSGL